MFRVNISIVMYLLTFAKRSLSMNVIDVDDILSKNFMPSSILLLENPDDGFKTINETLQSLPLVSEKKLDGNFDDAIKTMNFHRSMMNQYLCRSFVASQILTEMTMPRIKRRMGNASPASEEKSSKFNVKNHLLEDEGSKTYSDWLSKSTTLEDIYRHYNKPETRDSEAYDNQEVEDKEKNEDLEEEFDGQVTDFVYQHNPVLGVSSYKHKQRGHNGLHYHHGGYYVPTAVHHGYAVNKHNEYGDGSYSEPEEHNFGHTTAVQDHDNALYHSYPTKYHMHHHSSGGGHAYDKENELADLFEVALTALAYLSFGMFLVHLIMSISAVTNNSTSTMANMMMPMSMSPTATAGDGSTGTDGTDSGTMMGTGGDNMPPTGSGSTGSDDNTPGGGTGTGTMDSDGGTGSMDAGTGDGAMNNDGGTGSMDAGTGDGTMDSDGDTGSMDAGTGGGTMDSDGDTGSMDAGTGGGTMDSDGDTGSMDAGTGGGTMDSAGGTGGDTMDSDGDTGSMDAGTGAGTTMMGSDGGSTGTGEGDVGTGDTDNGGATGTDDSTTGTGADDSGDGMSDSFKFRLRRQVPELTNVDNRALNELARKVLTSIEAALIANSDNGACLRKSICENNKFSRSVGGHGKIFIPIWSLGMSWLSGRLVKKNVPTTSMLDSLKASILGLGKANCEIIYQKCDLRLEKRRRRRRRK